MRYRLILLCAAVAGMWGCTQQMAPVQEIGAERHAPASQPAPAPAEAATAPAPEPQVEVNSAAAEPPIESRPLPGSIEVAPGSPAAPPAGAAVQGPVTTEPRVYTLPYSEKNLAMVQGIDAGGAAKPAQTQPAETQPAQTQPAESKPEEAKPPEAQSKGVAPQAANATKLEVSPEAHKFIWPVTGRVIGKFEGNNKGIDIAADEGEPVQAAAGGNVLYAGSGIRGYGQLLIIKHSDDFLSVYAHNNKLLVKQGDTVKQGQKVAEVGHTDADRSELHFEIRHQGASVDPLQYLPQLR